MKNERCEKCECWHSEDNPVVLDFDTDAGGLLLCLECVSDEEIDWDLWESSARAVVSREKSARVGGKG